MKRMYTLLLMAIPALLSTAPAQDKALQYAFQPQEKISYNVYYSLAGIYFNAGWPLLAPVAKWQNEEVFSCGGRRIYQSEI